MTLLILHWCLPLILYVLSMYHLSKKCRHSLTLMPQMSLRGTSWKEVKSSTQKKGPSAEGVCVCVCVAVRGTCCFNRRCADVTAEAKKPPLKGKDLKKEKASSVRIKQWKNWPLKQMSGRLIISAFLAVLLALALRPRLLSALLLLSYLLFYLELFSSSAAVFYFSLESPKEKARAQERSGKDEKEKRRAEK